MPSSGLVKKNSCSKPNHHSSETNPSQAFLVLDECGVLSGESTSHITKECDDLGPTYSETGFIMQSELPPSACCVDEPSKAQSGGFPSATLTLLLSEGSG